MDAFTTIQARAYLEGHGSNGTDIDAYTNPELQANLVFRVILGIVANLVCWVPLRLLYRNGEFAVVVLIITVMILNLLTVINALIWQDDNISGWSMGHGWCDFHNYFYNPLLLMYSACFVAIMRNLAGQLGTLRANPLTGREKTRRNLIQALIIFPLPLIQLAWIYPLSQERYAIGTLVGCIWVTHKSWPFIVFFVLPAPILGVVTGVYTVLTWRRFKEVQKTTKSALSTNSLATSRAARASRRLYSMTLAILIPYIPLTFVYAVFNLLDALPLKEYNFAVVHNRDTWSNISLFPSTVMDFTYVNANYIPILTAIPIFWFFGMTKDAVNVYRCALLKLGLGRFFPRLEQEYDPDNSEARTNASQRTRKSSRSAFGKDHPALELPDLTFQTGGDVSSSPAPPPSEFDGEEYAKSLPFRTPLFLRKSTPFNPFRLAAQQLKPSPRQTTSAAGAGSAGAAPTPDAPNQQRDLELGTAVLSPTKTSGSYTSSDTFSRADDAYTSRSHLRSSSSSFRRQLAATPPPPACVAPAGPLAHVHTLVWADEHGSSPARPARSQSRAGRAGSPGPAAAAPSGDLVDSASLHSLHGVLVATQIVRSTEGSRHVG